MGQGQSGNMKQKEVEKLKDLTSFSGHEIREWYDKFHKDFPSGVISKPEFLEMYKKLFPDGDPTRFSQAVFKAYDTDGNGVISFKEFLTTISIASRGTPEEKLEWAFSMYDTNGDQSISRKEAIEIIWSIYRARGEGTRLNAEESAFKIFIALDKNKDDRLSKAEFFHGVKSSASIMEMLFSAGNS